MSDITKKILSLEPEIDADPAATNAPSPTSKTQSAKSAAATSEAKSSKRKKAPIIASVTVPPTVSSTDHASDIPSLRRDLSKPDSFPDFISRPRPNADVTTAPPMRGNERSTRNLTDQNHDMNHNIEPPKTGWIIWTGLALSLIWVAASTALYWGLFGTPKALSPIALSGFIMAVALPAILITLLCISWRRLAQMSHQADRMAHAAQILTRADESALINTRNLALGIQSELSMVDEHLNKMVDRFEGLKTDISSHSHDINTVGLALTERSDDVGRNLTLQRQALESITNTFDTRMETLSDTIETQSQKLSEVTGTAVKNIESAELSLTQATETLSASEKTLLKTGQDTHSTIEKTAQSLTHNQESLSQLHTKISELISALTKEQETVKANLAAQSQSLQDMSSLAKTSTESLQENLNLGADLLTALSSANQGTQETLQQRFKDMEQMIGETQNRADSLAEAANARVRDTISQTRTDLSKLEADMKALGAQLQTAREESLQLSLSDIDTHKPPAQSGFGRLHLKPLETDFPPVEPPRFTSQPRQAHLFDAKQNDEDLSESFDEAFGSPFELSPIDASPVNTSPVNISPINTSPLNTPMEGPINLGAASNFDQTRSLYIAGVFQTEYRRYSVNLRHSAYCHHWLFPPASSESQAL